MTVRVELRLRRPRLDAAALRAVAERLAAQCRSFMEEDRP